MNNIIGITFEELFGVKRLSKLPAQIFSWLPSFGILLISFIFFYVLNMILMNVGHPEITYIFFAALIFTLLCRINRKLYQIWIVTSSLSKEVKIEANKTLVRDAWNMRLLYQHLVKLEDKFPTGSEDFTFIIGIRNRVDYRIDNALNSIRAQIYSQSLVKICVVDFKSEPDQAQKLQTICEKWQADYVRTEGFDEWNRSAAMNIGINASNTSFVIFTDADVIFEPNFLQTAITELREDPLKVVYSRMRDLPADVLINGFNFIDHFTILKKLSFFRHKDPQTEDVSIIVVSRSLFEILGGFDVNYRWWGREDTDLFCRLKAAGIVPVDVSSQTSILHQWHAKFEGVEHLPGFKEQIRKNNAYFTKYKSIFRPRLVKIGE
jgi:predicted glycosyltransferase involved in capsule biosynthesis